MQDVRNSPTFWEKYCKSENQLLLKRREDLRAFFLNDFIQLSLSAILKEKEPNTGIEDDTNKKFDKAFWQHVLLNEKGWYFNVLVNNIFSLLCLLLIVIQAGKVDLEIVYEVLLRDIVLWTILSTIVFALSWFLRIFSVEITDLFQTSASEVWSRIGQVLLYTRIFTLCCMLARAIASNGSCSIVEGLIKDDTSFKVNMNVLNIWGLKKFHLVYLKLNHK
jgi:hypothetical protein